MNGESTMNITHRIPARARLVAGGLGAAAAAYLAHAGWTWLRFGMVASPAADDAEPLLDVFMPDYDVVERHHEPVNAPAAITLTAASEADLQSPVAATLFAVRALALGGTLDNRPRPGGFRQLMQSIGWEVLAEVPGRELIFGAVATPWDAEPAFRPVGKHYFAGFNEPGFVKIVLTLRADPVSDDTCIFRTETRAAATDPFARARFRRYWAFVAPGIRLIRRAMLDSVKRTAEGRTAWLHRRVS
jgi:hypothetical protein